MKRPPGIILTCGLLVLLALSLLSFEDGAGAGGAGAGRFALLSLARLLLAFVSAVAAVALWQRWPRALRVYWCWGTAYLGVGCALPLASGSEEPVETAIRIVVLGAVLAAVGAHLRWALRQGVAPGAGRLR